MTEMVSDSSIPAEQMFKPTRLFALDFLRGVAVLLVLGNHLPAPPEGYQGWVSNVLLTWKLGGWVGVDLFFVLSGFLVSGLLMNEWKRTGKVKLRRFLYRRGLKIYPSFYVMLFASSLVIWVVRSEFKLLNFVSELLFLQSYLPRIWNHTWSLAVEEHFYIGLAIACGWLVRKPVASLNPFKKLLGIGLIVLVICFGIRSVMAAFYSYSHGMFLIPTHLRIDSLGFGVMIAYVYHFHHERLLSVLRKWNWLLLLLGIFAFVPAFIWVRGEGWYLHTLGFTVLYLGSGALLLGAIGLPRISNSLTLLAKPVAVVGVHSYSIYLWHMPTLESVALLVRRVLATTNYSLVVGSYLVLSIIFGIVFYKLIELPVLIWRDRIVPA